jgi:hypothetical protein
MQDLLVLELSIESGFFQMQMVWQLMTHQKARVSKANYLITEEDYVNSMKLYSRLLPGLALRLVLIVVFLLIASFLVPSILQSAILGGLVGGGLVLILGRFFLGPMLARRHYRKYKAIQEPIQICLRDDGVEFTTVDAAGVVKWEKILKWRQNDEYLLIYLMPRLYHIIPKSIASGEFDFSLLVRMLGCKVGAES